MSNKKVKVTLVKSISGRLGRHKGCIRGLGLKRINSSAVLIVTDSVQGMIDKVSYLLKVEEA